MKGFVIAHSFVEFLSRSKQIPRSRSSGMESSEILLVFEFVCGFFFFKCEFLYILLGHCNHRVSLSSQSGFPRMTMHLPNNGTLAWFLRSFWNFSVGGERKRDKEVQISFDYSIKASTHFEFIAFPPTLLFFDGNVLWLKFIANWSYQRDENENYLRKK